ncbi:MAG: hypothetical protein JWM41_183 [Gemmatimonadetes bacterium]|nr:hypothetical protein [Gemmatimonadota bacterium]
MQRLTRSLVAIAATAVCACSPKDAAKTDSPKVAQSGTVAPAAAAASRGTFDPATHTAVIHAKDFSFEAPDSITAGWTTFHLVNEGPNLHHVQIVRLDSGKTAKDLEQALHNPGPPPRWAVFVGGPNAPDPGGQSEAMLNLAAGQYMVICVIDIPEHVPHFAKGMVHPLTVTAASGPAAAEPTADVTVSLADYNFDVKGTLSAGKHTIKVVNSGPQPHEVELIRLAPGKTPKDVWAWINNPSGPPPGNAVGGVVAFVPGGTNYFTAVTPAGDYALFCFVPDGKDGKAHLEHGMVKQIKIS